MPHMLDILRETGLLVMNKIRICSSQKISCFRFERPRTLPARSPRMVDREYAGSYPMSTMLKEQWDNLREWCIVTIQCAMLCHYLMARQKRNIGKDGMRSSMSGATYQKHRQSRTII